MTSDDRPGWTERRIVHHHTGRSNEERPDSVVTEAPMEIRLDGVPLAVIMRTPGADRDLVAGFALTEGILIGPDELRDVVAIGEQDDDARYELLLAPGVHVDAERFRRNFYATSSCGVCGKASIDAVRVAARVPPPGPIVDDAFLGRLPDAMRRGQAAFDATGGLHAAALFDPDGSLLSLHEDVGRHNAVDKLVGSMAPESWPIGERILLVSGRISFEIIQKAAVAGIPIVAGISAATSLAIDLADELAMTLIGFLRDGSFNVYTGASRIDGLAPQP